MTNNIAHCLQESADTLQHVPENFINVLMVPSTTTVLLQVTCDLRLVEKRHESAVPPQKHSLGMLREKGDLVKLIHMKSKWQRGPRSPYSMRLLNKSKHNPANDYFIRRRIIRSVQPCDSRHPPH